MKGSIFFHRETFVTFVTAKQREEGACQMEGGGVPENVPSPEAHTWTGLGSCQCLSSDDLGVAERDVVFK